MVGKELSIIIPIYNEEQNIEPVLRRIDTTLKQAQVPYEVIAINDHSTDKSAIVLHTLSFIFPVRTYLKDGKRGKATSLLQGFSHARYSTICMIDADLQYPPEVIPQLLQKIEAGYDVVVADRVTLHTPLKRKVASYLFYWVFVNLLYGFKHDVQSGLKVCRKEIIQRITLSPAPWAFDLEFMIKARNAGYRITGIPITFEKRLRGKSKRNLIIASLQVTKAALLLAFKDDDVVPLITEGGQVDHGGFHFKGRKFVHHTALPPNESAFKRLAFGQAVYLFMIFYVLLIGFLVNWHTTIVLLISVLTTLYFLDLIFNLFLIYRSFSKPPEIQVSEDELNEVSATELPVYTIFCPLYKEWEVLPQFVSGILRLDYPKEKLQVLLLLEEDDQETIAKVSQYNLPEQFKIIVVPDSQPKTKPKALNYGLKHAKGEYVVIYDAEDVPEPNQLKKAVIGFAKANQKTVCIQAKLSFYNPKQNILTKLFTAEYALWFNLVLNGLQSITAPIPLGGTSNHFKTKDLRLLKGWDSFNVTEDCDLGIRLVKRGFRTAIIDSYTFEEANSDIKNWFNQRTRWVKGYIQTYLVHMRNPQAFLKNWKEPHVITFQIIVGGKVLSMFINPLMWIITLMYFALRPVVGTFIESFFPTPILYMGVLSLFIGNFLYMYYYMLGCAKRGHDDLIKYAFLVPVYWLFMSIAAWRAILQIVFKPHYWAKTKHGFHLQNKKALTHATAMIGQNLVDDRISLYSPAIPSTNGFTKASNHEKNHLENGQTHPYVGQTSVQVFTVQEQLQHATESYNTEYMHVWEKVDVASDHREKDRERS